MSIRCAAVRLQIPRSASLRSNTSIFIRTLRRDSFAALVFACTTLSLGAASASAQGGASLQGTVISVADSGHVFAAEIRSTSGHTLGRSDRTGAFSISANAGDSIVVRALGFREMRLVAAPAMRIALRPVPTVLPTMTTTVGQREMRASDATVRTTVLDREKIDAAAAISANQLLRQIPGLQELPGQPAKTSIAVRGFDAARVLILIDGEPAAGSLIENRDIGRLSTVAAERIEVTKGPSSVEFGSDALGGVINLVTAAPTRDLTTDALFRQGELGRREATLGASQTVGNFGYRVSGGWRQVDRVTAIDQEGSSLERVFDLRTSGRYKLSDRSSLRADVQGSRERQRWPVGSGYNGFIDNFSGQGFVEGHAQVLGGSIRARGFAQRYSYQYRQSQRDVPIAGSGDSLEQRERMERFLLAYSRSAGRQTIDVGVQLSSRDLISPDKVDGDSATDNVSEVFARDSWKIGPVLANVGARYTNSSLWGDAFNPSVGAAWQVNPNVRFRTNIARGFRAPGFKEIRYTFSNPSAQYTIVGNADLVPESSWSTTVGGTWAPVSTLSIDVEGYRNNVTDLIDTRFQERNAAGFQIFRNVNVARARTSGVETNISYSIGSLALSAGYDYLRARDLETGMPLNRRATHTGRAQATRTWGLLSGVTTDVTARYTGSAPLVSTDVNGVSVISGEQGAFLSIDAQVRANLTQRTELSFGGNNLLNQMPAMYTPAFQRQFFVAFRVSWSRTAD
ncbi:MAG: TonB-dependent receptor plug domain-containing protein [Gemmatimonas sp.]